MCYSRFPVFVFLLGLSVGACEKTPLRSAAPAQTVLFLCPYGGAKSVMAASYFTRLAHERGLPLAGVAAATEQPYEAVPPAVAASLSGDGFNVSSFRPRRVEPADLAAAVRIVTIDCETPLDRSAQPKLTRWENVPKVSADLHGATRAIRQHVAQLVDEFAPPNYAEVGER